MGMLHIGFACPACQKLTPVKIKKPSYHGSYCTNVECSGCESTWKSTFRRNKKGTPEYNIQTEMVGYDVEKMIRTISKKARIKNFYKRVYCFFNDHEDVIIDRKFVECTRCFRFRKVRPE